MDKISPYDIVKSPLITEKLQVKQVEATYGFLVDRTANKIQIKKAVEKIYQVNVVKVNIINMPGKKRRLRFKEGYSSAWKKALVKIKEGQIINLG